MFKKDLEESPVSLPQRKDSIYTDCIRKRRAVIILDRHLFYLLLYRAERKTRRGDDPSLTSKTRQSILNASPQRLFDTLPRLYCPVWLHWGKATSERRNPHSNEKSAGCEASDLTTTPIVAPTC